MRCHRALVVAAAALAVACGRGNEGGPRPLRIHLDTANGLAQARIVVSGIDADNLRALRASGWRAETKNRLLQILVADNATNQVAGRYAIGDTTIEFRPLFPFEAGRSYAVRVEPSELPVPRRDSAVTSLISFPAAKPPPSTVVRRIMPTSSAVPENLLRLYVEFSAPMSRQSGVGFVHLINDSGHEVANAFLPLDADFWSPDHTRYTVFLDPGRVKRGIRPNEQMGRALKAGRAYALVIDSAWHDANGVPLAKSYRYEFTVGPAVTEPIALAAWKVAPPRAGGRAPLTVTFPRPIDHGIVQRALGVETAKGTAVVGTVAIGPAETQWRFTPRDAWQSGDYAIVVLSILEDVAGNRIGRAFEADMFDRVDSTAQADRHRIPFKIR